MAIPMPNEKINGAVVVASVYVTEDTYMVLLLNPEAPYYTVADVDDNRRVTGVDTFLNIVPAVECYQDQGGDF